MRTSNRAPLALVVVILFSGVAARCSAPGGSTANETAGQSATSQRASTKIAANLTDLPTYPNVTSATMMGHPPTQGGIWDAHTNDSYDQVLAWYRGRLPGAKEAKSIVDGVNGQRGIELHVAKWNEQVVITSRPGVPGTAFALTQDAH
jgi:hypothetical protein